MTATLNPDFPIRVRMTCCNTEYASVADTIDHECPAPAATLPTDLYDRIIDAERRARSAKGRIELRGCGVSMYRLDQMYRSWNAEKAKLDTLLSELFALGDDVARAFGAYRQAVLTGLANAPDAE